MTSNDIAFVVFPYVAMVTAVVVSLIRWRRHPFSVSSLSSQLLESRRLYWGSVSFHWGIVIILLGHLLALLLPGAFVLWNGAPLRLYALEITGVALGLWTLFGLAVLGLRRLLAARIRAVTTPMDAAVLLLLVFQVVTGLWIALVYRFGSFWGTAVFVPWLRSLLTLHPKPSLLFSLPFVLKAHAFGFFALLAVFPFSRLVHIVTLPLGYLTRPWQRVVRQRPEQATVHPSSPTRPLERAR